MRVAYYFGVLCALKVLSIAQCRSTRRLRPDNPAVYRIENTEIFQASNALMVSRAVPNEISTNDTPCSSPSYEWIRGQFADVSSEDLTIFFDWHIHTLPFAYKLFVEPNQEKTSYEQEYFGLNGEYTEEVRLIHDQAQDFWSSSGVDDDIQVLCAHGTDLANKNEKLIPTLEVMFSSSYNEEYSIDNHANDIQDLILRLPGGYSFPLLTFNAFATDEKDTNDFPSIIIGDGFFVFQDYVGLVSEGPEYVLTHEHAHHIQFSPSLNQDDIYSSIDTRRHELMADAFSGYFLAHNRGGNMTPEQILNVSRVSYSVGDCEMDDETKHHGTPRQRQCATRWGASLANLHENTSFDVLEIKMQFDAWYEILEKSLYDQFEHLDSFCDHTSSAASFTRLCAACIVQLLFLLYLFANVSAY